MNVDTHHPTSANEQHPGLAWPDWHAERHTRHGADCERTAFRTRLTGWKALQAEVLSVNKHQTMSVHEEQV